MVSQFSSSHFGFWLGCSSALCSFIPLLVSLISIYYATQFDKSLAVIPRVLDWVCDRWLALTLVRRSVTVLATYWTLLGVEHCSHSLSLALLRLSSAHRDPVISGSMPGGVTYTDSLVPLRVSAFDVLIYRRYWLFWTEDDVNVLSNRLLSSHASVDLFSLTMGKRLYMLMFIVINIYTFIWFIVI